MQEYKAISADVWGAFKKYVGNPPKTDKEWDECLDEFENLNRKHQTHHEYAREYIGVCINELERIWKASRK